jgi:prepilin-type N-terminal cleavage/methylation domain-containing protein
MNKQIIDKGFTLAEVLLTLLIIGIISSLVIPEIISDTQQAEFKTAAKKAYGEISNVTKQMKQDNGTLSGYLGNEYSFKPDFMKYFSVIKDCGIEDCVPSSNTSNIYKSLTGDPANTQDMGGDGQFVINNGMFINIQNSSYASNGILIVVDVNGYKKGPNVYGKDTFMFQLVNDVFLPMGAPGTNFSTTYNCTRSNTSARQGCACAANILQNKDY